MLSKERALETEVRRLERVIVESETQNRQLIEENKQLRAQVSKWVFTSNRERKARQALCIALKEMAEGEYMPD